MLTESEQVRARYARRNTSDKGKLYNPLLPSVYLGNQEKERALIRWIQTCGLIPVADKKVLEIGCGTGANLLQLLQLGFRPENLVGNELLEERAREARYRLPAATEVLLGDACELSLPDASFDVVYQSTVFTSLLDETFQQRLADRMWALVRPGGGVLWYDFLYNNPRNQDVRGVPLRRVQELFPRGVLKAWRVTLAPPISRFVTRLHPSFYSVFNVFPVLRTHILCYIQK